MSSDEKTLEVADEELFGILRDEEQRQFAGLELIASENFTSKAVMQALGTVFTNKYSEGYPPPGKRYYGGNTHIDRLELLCQKRALAAYSLSPDEWAVNVQPYSGSTANFEVYTALLQPGDKIMGLELACGGHLTHGFWRTDKKTGTKIPVNASAIFFDSYPYKTHPETGLLDYDAIEQQVSEIKPKILITGASAYARDWDYTRFRQIADSVGAYLMCDMAHTSGLIASGLLNTPFESCDIVTTTTHKSLRGPRGALIFSRVKFAKTIDSAVFPGCQGGPHNNTIAAIAVQLKEVNTEGFKEYSRQVIKNSQCLAASLRDRGYSLITGGTDNHLVLWDLRPKGLTGSKFEALCDEVGITVNKNSVPGDKSALSPGGVRVGTPALTTRGLKESEFKQVADFLDRAVKLCLDLQQAVVSESGSKKLKDFKAALHAISDDNHPIRTLGKEVDKFSRSFFFPGFCYSI